MLVNKEGVSASQRGLPKGGGTLVNRLLPLATPKLSQPGDQLSPIEVEFIDPPCGFKSTDFDLSLKCVFAL